MVIYGDNLNWFNVKIAGKIVYEFLEIQYLDKYRN